jgi:hypothetical protein
MNQSQTNYRYQVGGSLQPDFPAYVERESDDLLYTALKDGEFCYVFNSRQMGKSSLMVRTKIRLEADGIACAVLDFSAKDKNKDKEQAPKWYNGIINLLNRKFKLLSNIATWIRERDYLSPVERLEEFIETVMLPQIAQPIVIFIDEIDSTLNLPFTDDFFALIRSCYNKRDNPDYRRLTFTLLGVATPTELIGDAKRTPFNIGKAIDLKGFKLEEAQPLAAGLAVKAEDTQAVLGEIIKWTGGQPFLTQRLCLMVVDSVSFIPLGKEAPEIEKLARSKIIQNWESQDEQEHLKTIKNRLLSNDQKAGYLLELYRQIRQTGELPSQNTSEEGELQLTGLVVKRDEHLRVYNPIYSQVFNESWIDEELGKLRPYFESFRAWVASGEKDESRLLRGEALEEAQTWSLDKNLSYEDKQFLAASQQQKIEEEIQAAEKEAELEREKQGREAAEKAERIQAEANRKAKRRIRIGSIVLGLALSGAAICGVWGFQEGQKATQAIKEASDAKEQAKEQRTLANQAKGEVQQQQLTLKSTTQNLKELNQRFQGVETQRKTAETRYKAAQTQVQQAQVQLTLAENQQRQAQETARSEGIKSQKAQAKVLVAQNQLDQAKTNLDTAEKAKKEAETATKKVRDDKKQADLVYANINKEIKTAQNLGQLAGELQDKGKTDESNEALRQAGLSFKVTDHNLKQALLLAGTSQAYLSLENQKEAQKSIEESQTSLAKAVKDNKTSEQVTVLVYSTQGQLSQAQEKIKEAITSYQKAFRALKASQYDPYNPNISPKIITEEQVETVHLQLLELLGNGQTQDNLKSEVEQSFKNHYVAKATQNIKELETLLKNKNWQEADQKTFDALLSSAYSKDVGGFSYNNVSCPALRQIDQLWVDNSKGVYGFSVQSEIYKKTGNPIGDYNEEAYRRFGQEVGWNVDNRWLNYKEMEWGEPKIKGHLPAVWGVWVLLGGRESAWGETSFLALRLVNCSI